MVLDSICKNTNIIWFIEIKPITQYIIPKGYYITAEVGLFAKRGNSGMRGTQDCWGIRRRENKYEGYMEIEVNRDLIYICRTKCGVWLHKVLHED